MHWQHRQDGSEVAFPRKQTDWKTNGKMEKIYPARTFSTGHIMETAKHTAQNRVRWKALEREGKKVLHSSISLLTFIDLFVLKCT